MELGLPGTNDFAAVYIEAPAMAEGTPWIRRIVPSPCPERLSDRREADVRRARGEERTRRGLML